MSEFLLLIPEGWESLDWQYITNNIPDMGQGNVLNWINSNDYSYMEPALKDAGKIPNDCVLVEAKLVNDEYFLVRLRVK